MFTFQNLGPFPYEKIKSEQNFDDGDQSFIVQ